MSSEVSIYDAEPVNKWLANADIVDRMNHALGGFMSGEDFIAQIMIYFQDPKIAGCTSKSKFEAAHKCASLALLPTLQQVALIPRKVWENGRVVATEVDVMPQWQGYKSLMERHPEVLEVDAKLVHVNDQFGYDAITETIAHQVFPFDPNRKIDTPEDIVGGYLKVMFRDRSRPDKFHFVPVSYIVKCRSCSQSWQWEQKDLRKWEAGGRKGDKPNPSVWTLWFEQQATKTCYRSAYYRRVVNFDPVQMRRLQVMAELDQAVLAEDPRLAAPPVLPGLPAPRPQPNLSRAQVLAGAVSGATAPAGTSDPAPPGETTTAAPEHSSTAEPAPSSQEPPPSTGQESGARSQVAAEPELSEAEQKRELFRASTERKFAIAKGMAEIDKLKADLLSPDAATELSAETRALVEQWHADAVQRLNSAKKPSPQKPLINQ